MAYQNTGYARNRKITITKGDDTPRDFYITDAFADPADSTPYEALSTEAFQRLPEAEYQIRLQAFARRLYADIDGLQNDCPDLTLGSVEWNPSSCPVPQQQQWAE